MTPLALGRQLRAMEHCTCRIDSHCLNEIGRLRAGLRMGILSRLQVLRSLRAMQRCPCYFATHCIETLCETADQLARSAIAERQARRRTYMETQLIESIARICHEVNRAYCAATGDASQPAWENAPDWQRASASNGVRQILAHPATTPEQSHEGWLQEKAANGWKYGPVKDAEKKEHPCFRPYAELPQEQRVKDYLFGAVVRAMAPPA